MICLFFASAVSLGPIAFVGPSAVGKGTLISTLMEYYDEKFELFVSHTTRKPRGSEINGSQYIFTTRESFLQMITNGEMLGFTEIHGNLYGTSAKAYKDIEATGKMIIVDFNLDGVLDLCKYNYHPFIILLLPPSMEELENRLRRRKTETEEQIITRLKTAVKELKDYEKYHDIFNLTIINKDLQETFDIIRNELNKYYKFDESLLTNVTRYSYPHNHTKHSHTLNAEL